MLSNQHPSFSFSQPIVAAQNTNLNALQLHYGVLVVVTVVRTVVVALDIAVKVIGAFVVVDNLIIVDVAIKRLYFNCVVVYERFTVDVEVVVPCDTDTLVVVWVVVKNKVVVWETV
jgi:hypothetical protein